MRSLFALFSLSCGLTYSQGSMAIGFASGSDFRATAVSGQLTVTCPGSAPVIFTCRSSKLEPLEYDFFLGPQGVQADKVVLSVLRQDSSQRTKDSSYNNRTGRSEERFNLWVASLFQRPLLADGVNQVHYKLTLKNQTVTEGDFSVRVSRQPARSCKPKTVTSADPNDCVNEFNICGRYFEETTCQ